MTNLRWIIRDSKKILQYRSTGKSSFYSSTGIIGDFVTDYDTGWLDVPEEVEEEPVDNL